MLPIVAIDVPADFPPVAASTMVQRCEQALGPGRCRLSSLEARGASANYVAVLVTNPDEPDHIDVEFRVASSSGAVLSRRSLAFSERDAEQSRWASVGLVIAGLVAADNVVSPPPARPAERIRRPAPVAPKRALPFADYPAWGLDLGVLAGPGLSAGPYRVGGSVRIWHRLKFAPRVILRAGADYSGLGGEPRLRWLSVGAGLGARWGQRASLFNAEVVGEVVGQRVVASVGAPSRSGYDSDARARFGGRIGLDIGVWASNYARFVLGAEATALTPPVRVELHNEVVGREPTGRVALTGALRFSL